VSDATISGGLDAAGGKTWFGHDRFGMFIHFGLYALGARHEWLKNREEFTTEAYQKYFDNFDPDLYDAREWARRAREAGMKYVVLTAKHHEGFCLWDSKVSDYKVTNTPYGKDLIGPYVEALRAEGLKVGFYYSLLDWHHPDFPIDAHHPQRNHPDAAKLNEGRDVKRYARYMRDQVTELLTNFGKIDVIERLGSDTYAYVAHEGLELTTVRLAGNVQLSVGQPVSLAIDPEQFHLFDKETRSIAVGQ
jgi:alpha-L-fucosidase